MQKDSTEKKPKVPRKKKQGDNKDKDKQPIPIPIVRPSPDSILPAEIKFKITKLKKSVKRKLKKKKITKKKQKKNLGKVKSNSDGICRVSGCASATVGSLALIWTSKSGMIPGLILNINKRDISIVLLRDENAVRQGDIVYTKGILLKIKLTLGLFGKIINPIGDIISKDIKLKNFEGLGAVEKKAKGIIDRVPVRKPLMTGIKAVDNLIPIGMGQRELIIGDKQTGKTSIAVDTILNYSETNNRIKESSKKLIMRQLRGIVWFVYCGIGQKKSTIANLYETLNNSRWYTSIVSASASDSAAFQFLAPYTGTTVGEYIRDVVGGDCVIIYDDLSKHAVAYRQMSLLLRRPPGREAYPGDVFYVHSRLLERAGALINRVGKVSRYKNKLVFRRGTLTALPVIETQAGDVSAYIPTNVISITDGQIFLESELFYKGIHPAINVGLSVSRVGSNAQHALLKLISGSLKVELAQYREVESFATFGAELDEHMLKLLFRGENLIEILKQDVNKPENMMTQIIQLFLGIGLNKKIIQKHKELRNSDYTTSSNFDLNTARSWLELFRTRGVNVGVENVKVFLSSVFTFIKNTNIDLFGSTKSSGEFLLEILYKNPSTFLNDIMTSYFLNTINSENYFLMSDYYMEGYNTRIKRANRGDVIYSELGYQLRNFDALVATSQVHSISLKTKKILNRRRNKRRYGTKLRLELVQTLIKSTMDHYRACIDGNYSINVNIPWREEESNHPFDEPDYSFLEWKFFNDWTVIINPWDKLYNINHVNRKHFAMTNKRRKRSMKTFKWNKFVISRLIHLYLSYFTSMVVSGTLTTSFIVGGTKTLLELSSFEYENRYGFFYTSLDRMFESYIAGKDFEFKTSSIFNVTKKLLI